MTVTEKVAYLKGLVDGLGLDTEKKEGKILAAIIDTLEDISLDLEALRASNEDLSEQFNYLAEDLSELEDAVYGEDEDGDEDDEEEDEEEDSPRYRYGRCCDDEEGCCGHDDYAYEVTCPSCNAEIIIDDEDLDKGSVVCPGCGATLDLEYDEGEDYEDEEDEDYEEEEDYEEIGDEDVAEQNDEE
ncbi:MAG: hypothetical protein GX189_04780 [Clostridiales bacterium]|nr:hypothetical protein [Clostridiales bacterium]